MAFGGSSNGGINASINITPLVDVVLVLLIIFMVMTPTLLKQMELTVPDKAQDVQLTPPPTDQVVVGISKEGKVSINKEMIDESALTERIHELMKSSRDKLVFFDIDDDANYGDSMHVMDVVRGAGAKTLGVMTKD
ncbi:MAG TPA: biopolymer transporter ExbD [Polyangia bacterium]|jgi:biopolymer transport protein ExbD|nr:biopolymer transporter ExbD [Polyangia bacterium]